MANESVYGYDPGIEGRPYNPAKARQLLTEAGYPDGITVKLIGGEGTELEKILMVIKAYLEAVGIKTDVEIADPALWKQYPGEINPGTMRCCSGISLRTRTLPGHCSIFISDREYGQTSVLRNFDNLINDALQARDQDTLVKTTRKVVRHSTMRR